MSWTLPGNCEGVARIEDAVDDLQGELVELLRRLIRIPTVNPPGDGYEDFCAALKATFDGLGYATEIVRVPVERLGGAAPVGGARPRPSLLATLDGQAPGPTVHLNGHYD